MFICSCLFQNQVGSWQAKKLHPLISTTDVIQGILITPGPVATRKAVRHTKKKLIYVTCQQFIDAAKALEQRNLGSLVNVQTSSKSLGLPVFLKKTPHEAESALNMYPEFCDVETYTMKYQKGSSKAISFQLRARLVSMKLVSPEHFM